MKHSCQYVTCHFVKTDPVTKSDKYKTVPLNDNSLLSAEITGKPVQSNNECPKSIIRITIRLHEHQSVLFMSNSSSSGSSDAPSLSWSLCGSLQPSAYLS